MGMLRQANYSHARQTKPKYGTRADILHPTFSPLLMVCMHLESLRSLPVLICLMQGLQGTWWWSRAWREGKRWKVVPLTVYPPLFAGDKPLHGAGLSLEQSPLIGNELLGPGFGKKGPAGTLRNGSPHLAGPINASLRVRLLSCEHMHKSALMSYLFNMLFLIIRLHSTSSRSYSGKAQL